MMGATGEHDGESADSGRDAHGFGTALAESARSIISDARTALSDPKLSEAETVHDIRKAFKRCRALMRLLAGPLGRPANEMRGEARDLMRALSGSRDGQAALDALADLRKSDLPISETSMKTIAARLVKMRGEVEATGLTPDLRQHLEAYLQLAALKVEQWPLASMDFDTVADALTVTYRRGRALLPDDWYGAEPEELHELRKRVVEHRHQMELVEPLWPRLAKVWAQEAQRLRERLGSCQDLAVLEGMMAPHQVLAPWRSRLAPLTADRRMAHLKASAKLASRLFAEKPRAFRSRIGALWKAAEDASGEE